MKDSNVSCYFVADIGGTNARFGCVRNDGLFFEIEYPMTFRNKQFADISDLIRTYFNSIPECEISGSCLAIAGPVSSDQVNITNLGWSFSISELSEHIKIERLAVINDFVSLAYSLNYLLPTDLIEIVHGTVQESKTKIVLGPGTGLGAAALVIDEAGNQTVVSTEAGHIGFSPGSELEMEILKAMQQRCDYVPVEDLVSGAALPTLYKLIARLRGESANDMTPSEITHSAREQTDPVCSEVVSLFCSMLASFAGDLALCFNASGCVYLGGGLLSKLDLSLIREKFRQQFRNKGRMSHILADIPVYLIKPGNAVLVGASNYYQMKYAPLD